MSNTSPLNYLILLQKDQILAALFGTVFIPTAVATELARPGAPDAVRSWIASPPPWLQIRQPRQMDESLDLDAGESQARTLAEELHADRILLDEAKARKIATARGLKVAGTLAVLFEAHERGLLNFAETMAELRATTFHLDEQLVNTVLKRLQKP